MSAPRDHDDDDEGQGLGRGGGFNLVTEAVPLNPAVSSPAVGVIIRVDGGTPSELRLVDRCRIGSGQDNDVIVSDRTVSRAHVEVSESANGGVTVKDLDSTNGTHFLGQRLREMTLSVGSRIQIGSVTVAFEPDSESLLTNLDYPSSEYRGIVGTSVRMRQLFALLQRLERSLATVLIEGESGVGKEMVARALHSGSANSAGRLVPINCGALPRDLVASELFGHRRGAFTGALEGRKGAFELAHNGTLFLDEVGELPLEVQPALLRALELGEIRPVGESEPRIVSVRVVAATNRDLLDEVAAGRFREDLYFRLAVVRVLVPPLRSRPEDIDYLARHFASLIGAQLTPDVLAELTRRTWVGNARELRNAIQSYAAIGQLPEATASRARSHEEEFRETFDPTRPYAEQKDVVVDEFTRGYLKGLLAYANGNQAAASKVAQLDKTHLGRMLAKYGMNARRRGG